MNNICVSVIVAVYKVPSEYLYKCIDSIINQTLREIEIILVDDGSPDNCGEICDAYAQKDSRIVVIHKKNGGLSSARNCGCKASHGKWIMFVDGDDWIESEMCSELYYAGEMNQVQLVMCGVMRDYKKTSTAYHYYLEEKIYGEKECKWLQQQILNYNANIAFGFSKLISRDFLFSNNIFHDEVLSRGGQGIEYNVRMFEYLRKVYFLKKPLYHYIYNENSVSQSHDEKNHEYVIKVFEKIDLIIKTSSNRELLEPWIENRILYVICTTAISDFFNPSNIEPYSEKIRKFERYLTKPIVCKALNTNNKAGIGIQRRIVLLLIKLKCYCVLDILGKVRKWQKKMK